jgi:hypothetical protein
LEEKMQRTISILFGLGLVCLGLLVLASNLLIPLIGFSLYWWQVWRLWPVVVLGAGLFLAAIPFLSPARRGLGVLFIPAFPILTSGSILFFASLFNQWHVWALLWPLEVLSVAAAFLFAALYTRSVWLGIPAILVGANGFVLAFCNLTGLWHWWAVLWTVEPLALGLCFLLIGAKTHTKAVSVIGLLLCAFAGAMASMMAAIIFSAWRLFSFFWPVALIVTGGVLLLLGLGRNILPPRDVTPSTPSGSSPAPASGS